MAFLQVSEYEVLCFHWSSSVYLLRGCWPHTPMGGHCCDALTNQSRGHWRLTPPDGSLVSVSSVAAVRSCPHQGHQWAVHTRPVLWTLDNNLWWGDIMLVTIMVRLVMQLDTSYSLTEMTVQYLLELEWTARAVLSHLNRRTVALWQEPEVDHAQWQAVRQSICSTK